MIIGIISYLCWSRDLCSTTVRASCNRGLWWYVEHSTVVSEWQSIDRVNIMATIYYHRHARYTSTWVYRAASGRGGSCVPWLVKLLLIFATGSIASRTYSIFIIALLCRTYLYVVRVVYNDILTCQNLQANQRAVFLQHLVEIR